MSLNVPDIIGVNLCIQVLKEVGHMIWFLKMWNYKKKYFIKEFFVKCNIFRWMFFFRTQLVQMYDVQFVRRYILCYQNHINIIIRYTCIEFFFGPDCDTKRKKTSVQNWSNIQTFDTWTIYMYVCGFLGQGNFTFLLTTMLSGIVLSRIVQYWQWLNGVLHLNPLVLLWESRLCVCQIY